MKWASKNLPHIATIMILYFDINDHKWVRSGKSTGAGGFISRHKQHEKHSKWRKGASSKFYLRYPSKTVTHTKSSNKSRRGYFENLKGKTTIDSKMIDMVSYLAELAYDLSISRVDNVSTNPGFESFLGVW